MAMSKAQLKEAIEELIERSVSLSKVSRGARNRRRARRLRRKEIAELRGSIHATIDEMYQGSTDDEVFDDRVLCQHCGKDIDGISFELMTWHHYKGCVDSKIDAEFEASMIDMIDARYE